MSFRRTPDRIAKAPIISPETDRIADPDTRRSIGKPSFRRRTSRIFRTDSP